jgi:hypothetical protein
MNHPLECDGCKRMFKDSRGLSVHKSRCRINYDTTCTYCNIEVKSIYILENHLLTCQEYKLHKLKQDFEKEMEARVSTIQEDLDKKDKYYMGLLFEKDKSYREQIETTQRLHESQLKMREDERIDIYQKYKEKEEKEKERDKQVAELVSELKDIRKKNDVLSVKMIQFAEKATDKVTTIYNGTTTIQQLQLQHFDASMFRDKIVPPTRMIYSVSQLVDHLYKFGFGNLYRCVDRSRNAVVWIDNDGTEVRDSNCSQIRERILVTLEGDIRRQLVYQIEREAQLEQMEGTDHLDELIGVRANIVFCHQLLDRNTKLMKELQRELAKRAKNKNDISIDAPKIVGYTKFLSQLEDILFPEILEWMTLSFESFGTWLGVSMRDLVHVEGGSFNVDKPFILIRNDEEVNKMIDPIEFHGFVQTAYQKMINELSLPIVEYLLVKIPDIDVKKLYTMIGWIEDPKKEDSQKVLRSMIHVFR